MNYYTVIVRHKLSDNKIEYYTDGIEAVSFGMAITIMEHKCLKSTVIGDIEKIEATYQPPILLKRIGQKAPTDKPSSV
jgi:hypothetical protein